MTASTIFEVDADSHTGEWLREPKATDEVAEPSEFLAAPDTDAIQHTTYESPFDGGTRLLRVLWQA